MLRKGAVLSLSFGTLAAFGKLYNSPAELPTGKSYDYIVVGSGPGGGVMARRLSELTSKKTLLIEAGVNPDGDILTEVPWYAPSNLNSIDDWNYTTTAQPGINGRSFNYNRGRALGGSSTLNFMVWTRGSQDDFDRIAKVTGDWGWSWNALLPYMTKVENMTVPADRHSTVNEWVQSVHGTEGPLGITQAGFELPTDSIIINATQELGAPYNFNADMNSGNTLGIGWSPSTTPNGQRASAWTGYVRPVVDLPNFDVVINAQVTRVIRTGTQDGVPVFRGVEFAQSSTSPRYVLHATSEIILSAGAVGSPTILLHSGIGPASELKALGIKPIVNNAQVGKNAQDHSLITNSYYVNESAYTLDVIGFNASYNSEVLAEWQENKTGPLTLNACNQLGWFRNPEQYTTVDDIPDPSAGPTSGHYELIFTDAFVSFSGEAAPTSGKFFTVFSNVVSPAGRGSVTLNSSNPFAAPNIDPGILASSYDLVTMREAIKAVVPFVKASSFDGFLLEPYGEYGAAIKNGTDAAIEAYARKSTTTVWHLASTMSMSSWWSRDGAINPDLTVKGAIGLRVVDASSFPFIPAAHTQAPVYILAERAADLVKAEAL
ncbi:alcohol oxidase [Vararia minispora EC-137]|uniref:Alcohol oxidase n=1 Tax=Vararia minispora EC-137 TaxID=1314806 RepID=A0ACB8QNM1_9AGAM|nr:alcohol oxidase [Vararia minispora EC-137]